MTDINLGRYQTIDAVKLATYGPGTVVKTMEIKGNAVLSSVFVKSADPGATVKVNYFQTSSGTVPDGERFDLTSHPLLDDTFAGSTSQIVVTRIHNKPRLEYIVTGGNVEFGVYQTVTDQLASDIDSALVLDQSTFDPDISKGIPIVCLDEATNQLFFLRCEGGSVPVLLQADGTKNDYTFNGDSTPGTEQTIINVVNTSGTLRTFIRRVRVACRSHGAWELLANGVIIAAGFTGPSTPNDNYTFDIPQELATNSTIQLKFLAPSSAPAICLRAFVQTTQKT